MTLDLLLNEGKITKLFSDRNYGEISSSRKIKINGKLDRLPNAKFYKDWMDKVLLLNDFNLGAYLQIREVFDYAIENSIIHGGNRIVTSFRYSDDFFFGSVKDNGEGFDVFKILAVFLKGKKYFKEGGQGLKAMNESNVKVGFNSDGNKTFILYEFNPNESEKLIDEAREYRAFLKTLGIK